MQISWQYLFIVSLLTVVYGQVETKNIRSISSGLSFGRCRGYCQQSINITSSPPELVASKQPNFPQESYSPVQRQFPFSSIQWEQLVSLLDLETFTALADRIGCPGCADGGIEWIQVDWADATKRVTFESGQLFKGLEGFVVNLRHMREEYIAQL